MALWLKILASITKQQKFIKAGPVASWLWVGGLGHCREACTDGFIAKEVVPGLVPGMKGAYRHAATLVDVGLWHEELGGYQINDYLDWNPSKAEIEEFHKKDRERKKDKAGIPVDSKRIPDGIQSEPSRARGRVGPAGAGSPSAVDSDGSEGLPEESARETAPTKQLLALFDTLHRQRFDDLPAEINGAKDAAILAAVWRRRGTDETERLIREFFSTRDAWIIQAGFTVGVFKTQIAKLITQRPRVVQKAEHWQDECQRIHGGRCGNRNFHAAKMAEAASA